MKKEFSGDKFFDINKVPTSEGILLFGIRISRIGNAQSPKKCFEYLKHLASEIQHTGGIERSFCGDYLYFNSDSQFINCGINLNC
ncbi:MAG: hypothetical protein IPL87_04645 [Candidatus Moraniibacteriota bacterium]|nr:MAG: hypothetical protein IPL87_04645 [Candidatus Moranbacteria bacterium]